VDEFVDFGEAVLRNLDALVPQETIRADLALELGLTAWMRQSETGLEEALDQLWEAREALITAGGLDPATEPVPFGGRAPQTALLHLAVYLGTLVDRAAAHAGCDTGTLARRAAEVLAARPPSFRSRRRQLLERRTS
jgi:hypothetical protein